MTRNLTCFGVTSIVTVIPQNTYVKYSSNLILPEVRKLTKHLFGELLTYSMNSYTAETQKWPYAEFYAWEF
jgi:hypothetical protein